jgi:PTS system nitrogen regulatory IIA component
MLADIAASHVGIGAPAIFAALDRREKLGSTGIGEGIGMPHAPVPGLDRPTALLARLSAPIDFEAVDEKPVDIVAVLLVPADETSANLNLLAGLARVLRDPSKLGRMRSAATAQDLYRTVVEA